MTTTGRRLAWVCVSTWLTCTHGYSGSVTSQQAIQAASTFLQGEQVRSHLAAGAAAKAQALAIHAIPESPVIRGAGGLVLAHVVKLEPAGFVVVSADRRISPVIAYSFDGSFPYEDSRRN